jgi:hypothetical protein
MIYCILQGVIQILTIRSTLILMKIYLNALFVISASLFFVTPAFAQATLTWKANTSGNWNLTDTNWLDSNNNDVSWTNGSIANIPTASSGTITITETVDVKAMVFGTSANYTINSSGGGTIRWDGSGTGSERLNFGTNFSTAIDVPIEILSGRTLFIVPQNANATLTLNGNISGAGGFSTGAGNDIRAIVLNGNNTFTGNVNSIRGSLQFNGQNTGLGNVLLPEQSRQHILAGTGSISLALGNRFQIGGGTIADRAPYVAPGETVWDWTTVNGERRYQSTIGTLSVATMDSTDGFLFDRNSRLQIQLGAGGASDLLDITGNLTFDTRVGEKGLRIWTEAGAFDGNNYTIMTWTGTRSGWFDSVWLDGNVVTGNIVDGWDLGNGYQLLVNSNSAVLQIPEPAYAAFLFLPAIGLALLLRRRQRTSC